MSGAKRWICVNRAPCRIECIRISLTAKVDDRQRMAGAKIIRIKWAQSNCPLSPPDGEFKFPHPGEYDGAQAECKGIRIAQFQRAVEQLESCDGVVLLQGDDVSRHCQRGCVVAAMGDRSARMLYC